MSYQKVIGKEKSFVHQTIKIKLSKVFYWTLKEALQKALCWLTSKDKEEKQTSSWTNVNEIKCKMMVLHGK